MTESRPNAISATEEAIVPAVSATRRGGHDVLAGAAVVPAVARVAAHDRVAGLGQQPFRAPQQVDQLVGHARPRGGAARGPPGDQGRDRVPSASCTTSVRSPSGPDRTARTRSLMIGSLRSGSGGDRMGSRSEPARRGTTWRANGRGDRTGMIVVWPKHWHRPRLASGTVAGPGFTGVTTKDSCLIVTARGTGRPAATRRCSGSPVRTADAALLGPCPGPSGGAHPGS